LTGCARGKLQLTVPNARKKRNGIWRTYEE
jgi:hypothetical protein